MSIKLLESYHLAWLQAHQNRTEQWLRDRLSDGFHIHHIDGNHDNDAPENLLLIEGSDHMALHGVPLRANARKRRGGRTRTRSYWRERLEKEIEGHRLIEEANATLLRASALAE